MGYSHKNSRGVTYYLHAKGKLMYFSKDPANGAELPDAMTVVENTRTGLPIVKKK